MTRNIRSYRFGDCELDLRLMELRRHGLVVPIQRRQFDLLCCLIQNRHRTVPRPEILMKVWPGASVSECSLNTTLRGVRRLIGDDGRHQLMIETRRGFGLHFVGPVIESLGIDASERTSPLPILSA